MDEESLDPRRASAPAAGRASPRPPGQTRISSVPAATEQHVAASPPAPPGVVLVVDDECDTREVLRDILADDGIRVLLASNGRECLRKAGLDVSAILLDVMMPSVDGVTVCRCLRDNPCTRDIPVIFLTACQGEQLEAAAGEAGAFDFLLKPVRAGELRAKVQAAVRLDRLLDPVSRRAAYERLVAEGRRAQEQEEAQLDERMDRASLMEE